MVVGSLGGVYWLNSINDDFSDAKAPVHSNPSTLTLCLMCVFVNKNKLGRQSLSFMEDEERHSSISHSSLLSP